MKEKFVNNLTNFVIKNKDCDEIKIKSIRYGLEVLYLSITKMLVLIVLVLFTKSFWEFICILIFYQLIRKFSFGLHASSSLICWIITLPIYVGGSLLIKYYDFNTFTIFIVWGIAFMSFVLWAPADTPKRPLVRSRQRKVQKLKTCIICIIYLFIILFSKKSIIIDAITLSLIIQSIMINPLIYKLTKTQFNNYRFYPNKV